MRAWVNGRLLADPDEAALSVLDHGITVGDGVFETIKAVNGEPFALTRHLRRLAGSAQGLGLRVPDESCVREAVAAIMADDADGVGRIRITLTGGPSPLGSDRGTAEPTLIVAGAGESVWEAATAIASVPWPRNERGALSDSRTPSRWAKSFLTRARSRLIRVRSTSTVAVSCADTWSDSTIRRAMVARSRDIFSVVPRNAVASAVGAASAEEAAG